MKSLTPAITACARLAVRAAFAGAAIALLSGGMRAQPAAANAGQAVQASSTPALADLHPVISLDGPWRFQIGDDPGYSSPTYDDSGWATVYLSKPIADQGVGVYSGFAWYRMRITSAQLAALGLGNTVTPPEILVTPEGIGQIGIYVNALQTGRTIGMADKPTGYQSPPFLASLSSPAADGSRVLALRTWAPEQFTIHDGLVWRVEVGRPEDVQLHLTQIRSDQWMERAVTDVIVAFLFFAVAVLGGVLYLAQRGRSEYLWLAVLCLTITFSGVWEACFGLSLLPFPVFQFFSRLGGYLFMAVTLEFILHFAASTGRRVVRVAQCAFISLPLLSLAGSTGLYSVFAVAAEVAFCAIACTMLFRAWRAGRRDAGVMLIPFCLASTGDSANTILDYFASIHWLPQAFASRAYYVGPLVYRLSTIFYLIFLFSLVAVILYRFIRVSQDEQRSAAEISAARSVQALLIPTQLPRSRHFVLESAYLPVNGVGGDFFQALPLKDDSLLIVVGDVSGKGLQAAMNSSTLVGALRNELSYDPATILSHLNRVLIGAVSVPGAVPELDAAPGFATCLCARVYPDGSMVIANAGHLSPYRDGREMEIEPSLPLGVIAGVEYSQVTHTLSKGDRLVFVSDGVVEATDPHGELFGFDRTRQVSVESARYIAQTAKRFGQTDDITVVSLYIASTRALAAAETASAMPAEGALETA